MVNKALDLVIDNAAKHHLKQACPYISQESVQNAEQVRAKLLACFIELHGHPQKFRQINTGCITMGPITLMSSSTTGSATMYRLI